MKNLKRILGLLLAVCVLAMSLPLTALAAAPTYSDIKGHWAEKVIEKWSEYDVVHGDDGKFRPDDPMTRGEFATVLTQLLGLEEKSANPFRDITGKEWYADAVLKAHAAGILVGDGNGNSTATSRIQRQEAFVMMGRALGVMPKTGDVSGALAGFNDKDRLSGWAKPMVAALVEGGYVNGMTSSTLVPRSNINRASVIQLFGATVKTYITKPGSYTADKDGFVVVKAQGSVSVSGDNAGVVVGAGSKGAKITVSSAKIKDGAKVDAPNAVVTLESSDIGGMVTVSSSAKNAEIVVPAGTTVKKIVTEADNVTISGDGEVKAVEVAGGDKVTVSTSGTAVTVDKDAGSGITAGGNPVKPGESSTTSGSGQGYGEEPVSDSPAAPSTPKYTIQYYVNGALKDTKTVTKSDTATLPTLTAPTVAGYTFANTWYLDDACTSTPVSGATPIKELLGEGGGTVLKLYIKGTPITYTVAFNGNGSDGGSMSNMTGVAYNTEDKLTANGFTKTGNTFLGWATSADGQKVYADEAPAKELTTEADATVTLYAVWQPNTYTVTYKANGGQGADATTRFTYGEDVTLTQADDCPFTRTGYHFNGWNTAANGSGTSYAGGTAYNAAANLTLYAKWEVNKYSISFNGNGATGGSTADKTDVAYDTEVSLTANGYTRTGYTFKGWARTADGEKVYNDNASVTGLTAENDGAVTLYAVWEINKYAVTFDVKGGNQVTGDGITDGVLTDVEHGSTITAPTAPTREGYTFKGWYKETKCTTPWNFATDKVTADTTLYANWEINTYTVTFDTDGGSAVESQSVQHGGKATAPSSPTKEGYDFDTWVTTKNGDDAFDFNNVIITGNTTVYAKWNPIRYEVTYDDNGKDSGDVPEKQVWTYGQTDEFLAAGPGNLTKSGYTFVSWNTANDGSGTTYLPGDPIVPTKAITLYAQWISDSAAAGTITFDGNGSDGGTMETQTYADNTPLTANGFTKTGCTFAGWSRNQDGTGARYEDGATLPSNPGDITLYAQWTMDVTLRLSENEGAADLFSEGLHYLQENSLLSLEADGSAALTYKAEGTVKFDGGVMGYFANGDGAGYSNENAPKIQDEMENTDTPNYNWDGNFLVFDIVIEDGAKYTENTTVSVKDGDNEIVATGKIVFTDEESKKVATAVVRLDADRISSNQVKVAVDWDGESGNEAVEYKLDVSAVTLQPNTVVVGQTISVSANLENDNTVVGQTSGSVDLKPADLLKDISLEDYGETIQATLKYVKDIDTPEGEGYYLTFQVNAPANTQPTGEAVVKLRFDGGDPFDPDAEDVVTLSASDFVLKDNTYTATVTRKIDPETYNRENLSVLADWDGDGSVWNENWRGFGTNLTFVPKNTAALMLTRDTNVGEDPGQDHWPFLFGTENGYDGGDHPANDLFIDGPDELAEKFRIEQAENHQLAGENTTVYSASGYLRFTEDFRAYANDRYPNDTPDVIGEESPTERWQQARSGWYVPVDIVNVQGVDATNAEAKVYNGNPANGGQLIHTITAFDRAVQTESGTGYPNSATLVQNLKSLDGHPLFIVVDWDTTNYADTVETLVLTLDSVTRQQPSGVQVTANDEYDSTAYGQDLTVNTEEQSISGTLLYTNQTPAGENDSGYRLPITLTAENAPQSLENATVQYRFHGPDGWTSKDFDVTADQFADNAATVLMNIPKPVAANPSDCTLEISVDWDGPDYTEEGAQTGHMNFGETGMWLNLYGLTIQSQYHLVSAHNLADETRLETVPQDQQTYPYDYVQWNEDGSSAKATATVMLDGDQYEYRGRSAGELVGGDFRITSDDGDTYYALGLVKYMENFNSYWFNHANSTFFYTGQTDNFSEEHFAKRELADAGLITSGAFEEWRNSHSNAASFGYYLVFDLEKGELGENGKIEITDTAADGADPVRTITAADFGDGDKLPVVYQLKQRDEQPNGQNEGPFANELTIKYYNDGSTESKSVALKLVKPIGSDEKEVLRPQNRTQMRFKNLVSDNATQLGMTLQPSKGPCDEKDPPVNFDLSGALTKTQDTPYKLTLNFTAPEEWPQIWNPDANDGSGAEEPTPDDAVVIRIDPQVKPSENPDDQRPEWLPTIEITKAQLTANPACVITSNFPLKSLSIDINWAGLDALTEDWANLHLYLGLWEMIYQQGPAPTYNQAELGTIVKSKDVIATSETVTVGGTVISDDGAIGTPNAFGVVNVNIAYEDLQPRMTSMGESVGHFGSFTLKAPENATAFYPAVRPDITPYQIMNDFPQWAQEAQAKDWCYYLTSLWCDGLDQQTMGAAFPQLRLNEGPEATTTTIAIQWYSGDDTNGYQPLGSPVYYAITIENNNPAAGVEKTSYMRLYTGDMLSMQLDEGHRSPVLDQDGTWLYLDGCYDATSETKTWTPKNWQALRLVSNTTSPFTNRLF